MKIRTSIGAGLLMALCFQPAFAADPPATAAIDLDSIDPKTIDPASALETARELRKLTDAGDADAAWVFFRLLVHFTPLGDRSDREHAGEWRGLRGEKSEVEWLQRAAELGSPPAISTVCSLGEDRLAPADLRERSAARCQELRSKFPAK